VCEAAQIIASKVKRGSDQLGAVLLASAGGGVAILGTLGARQPDGVLHQMAKRLHGIVPPSAAPQLDFILILIGGSVFLLTWALHSVRERFGFAQGKE
jgi:hypothetical protein